jgi:two-component system, NtrC family, sensor histidine kinase HydH
MPDQTPSKKNPLRDLTPLWLLIALIAISVLHYETVTGSALLHEISQRLYYLPIIYAAYRYGLRGGLTASLVSAALYFPHIVQHLSSRGSAINLYAETILFLVIGAVTGLLAGKERRERERYENAAAELQRAYDELRATVEQLLIADRHSSLGRMSAAIVHEIRNPLGAIKGAAEALESSVPREREEFLGIIKLESDRLNGLVTDFLRFARPRALEMLPTLAHEVIDSVVKLARNQAERSRVRIEIFAADDLPPVMMDAEQMKQVLLNLILNAIDAMPKGGCLTINAGRSGDGLVIAVKDMGEGIDPAVRATLFSPFVTTKARGSGLGLAIAHRLVSQHGGRITADDAVGGGAVFQVWLPLNSSGNAIHAPVLPEE